MSQRHNAIKASLDRGYASEWNDDHYCDFTDRVNYCGLFYINAIADIWNLAQETSGTATTISWDTVDVGMRLRAAGGVGNVSAVRHMVLNAASDITNTDQAPIFNCAVNVGTPTADNDTHEFGLISSAAGVFAANKDGAYFRISNNVLFAVTGDGAAETATNLGAPNQYGHYRIVLNSVDCKFYVDDLETPVATHTAAGGDNLPNSDMTIKFAAGHRAGGTNDLDVQAFGLSVLRTQ